MMKMEMKMKIKKMNKKNEDVKDQDGKEEKKT